MAEINFYDGTICITDVSLVLLAQEAPDKIHAPRGSVTLARRKRSSVLRGYPGLALDSWRWSIESRGTCQRATVISIIYLSGENGAWRKKAAREWFEWSTSRRSTVDFSSSLSIRTRRIEIKSAFSGSPGWSINLKCKLTFEIRHGEPVAVDPRRVDVRVKGPEGRRAYVVETLQQEG